MLPKKKQLSGAETRRKKKESDPKILPLKDSLNKFFTSSSNVDVIEEQGQETTPEHENSDVEVNEDGASTGEQINFEVDADSTMEEENLQPSSNDEQEDSLSFIFDPRTWEVLDNSKRDILIEKGPIRVPIWSSRRTPLVDTFHMLLTPES